MASAPDPSREIFFERPLDSPPEELQALSLTSVVTTRWDNVPSPEAATHGRAPQTQRQHKMPTICLRGLHFIRRLVFVIGVLVGSVVALGLMGVMGLLLLPALLLGALVEGVAKVLVYVNSNSKLERTFLTSNFLSNCFLTFRNLCTDHFCSFCEISGHLII